MRTLVVILVLLSVSVRGLSQVKGSIQESDTVNDEKVYLSSSSLNKKIKQVFGQLATGQSNSSVLANYADADILNGKLGFNGAASFGDKLFLSVNASGKINNSVSEIFSGFKLNSNTSIDLKAHIRFYTSFFYTESQATELEEAKNLVKIKYAFLKDATETDSVFTPAFVNSKSVTLKIISNKLTALRNAINYKLRDAEDIDTRRNEFYQLILDSLNIKKSIDSASHLHKDKKRFHRLRKKYADDEKKELEDLELNAPWQSMHLAWATIRINPFRQKFYLYDSLKSIDKQVTDTAFSSAFYGVEGNYYYWNKNWSFYGNVGVGYEQFNNLDSLDSYEIVDTREDKIGVNSRKFTNKYNAYTGNYRETNSWKAYINLFFFTRDNKSALHVFGDSRFYEDGPTVTNLGLGYVISFKSRKDEKTTINAEPYVQWLDLGNNLNSEKSGFRRNTIGLRIGLPINPISGKK